MASVKLGQVPKSFKKTVTFPLLDGTEGAITCTFKYRTRKQFGAFLDEMVAAAEATKASKPSAGGEPSMADLMDKLADGNAEYILRVLDGWDLADELNAANVQQLSDEMPGAAAAIMEAYRAAIVEGRVKN